MEVGFLQETKSILKSLVVSCPNGMTVDRLNRDYREMEGGWIPFQKLGFLSLELFLKSIPDTLVVTGHGREARIGFVSSDKLRHMNEMVSRQKNSTRDRKVAALPNVSTRRSVEVNTRQSHVSGVPGTMYCTFNRGSPMYKPNQSQHQPPPHYANNRDPAHGQRNQHGHHALGSQTYAQKKVEPDSWRRTENFTSKPQQQDRRKNTDGVMKIVLDEPNNTRSIIAHGSVSRSILSEPYHPSRLSSLPPSEDKSQHKSKQPVSPQQDKPKKTVEIEPRATSRQSAGTTYSEAKDASLDSYNLKKLHIDPFSQLESSENDYDEAVPEFAANNLVFQVDFPENTVPFGKKIPRCDIPENLKKGSVVGVFISEIHSPFKFWFHIYKSNHELDVLMNRIECFYRRLGRGDLDIPKTCIVPGQVCAGLYNNLWHRAEILTNVSNDKVKVHFFDYGTVSEIEIKNVKYLPTIFAHTPMQAVRGSLSHIKPISPLWPKSAIREFLSMVSEVLLYAQIVEIDEKEDIVYMVLCDTNNGETVQINKQLVDKGFAKLDPEWDENRIAKNGYRKRHPREIFPTFEMLETGEYPSLFELEQLSAQGVDYEKITEKIIFSNLNNGVRDELVARENSSNSKDKLSFKLLDTNPFKSDIISEIVTLKIFDDNY